MTTLRLHRNTQQQITDDADKFRMDLLAIFFRNSSSRHNEQKIQLQTKTVNYIKARLVYSVKVSVNAARKQELNGKNRLNSPML